MSVVSEGSWAEVAEALPCAVCGLPISDRQSKRWAVVETGGPFMPVHAGCRQAEEPKTPLQICSLASGALVLLKSGGPLMVAECSDETGATCWWYDEEKGEYQTRWFPLAVLAARG